MPISTNAGAMTDFLCRGGFSFGRKRVVLYDLPRDSKELGPHETLFQGQETRRYCRRCRAYMGCFYCAQHDSELICLRCHDWALDEGEREHGKMLNRELVSAKVHSLTDSLESQTAVSQSRRGSEHELDWQDQERRQTLRKQAKSLIEEK